MAIKKRQVLKPVEAAGFRNAVFRYISNSTDDHFAEMERAFESVKKIHNDANEAEKAAEEPAVAEEPAEETSQLELDGEEE